MALAGDVRFLTVPTRWDLNLRANLRLWPDVSPNIVALASLAGEPYDEEKFVEAFPEGVNDPRAVRQTLEMLAQCGMAYREDTPEDRFRLSRLGSNLLSFLGVPQGPEFANEENLRLAARPLIRSLARIIECRAIWMLMLGCDNQLSNEELNRAIKRIESLDDIPAVAADVMQARLEDDVERIGPRVYDADKYGGPHESDQRKAMNPQFLLAGGGGIFISVVQTEMMRRIAPWAVPFLEHMVVAEPPSEHAALDAVAVVRRSDAAGLPPDFRDSDFGPATEARMDQVVEVCENHGDSNVILLAGVPATGKTLISLVGAQRLAEHPNFVRQIQFHPGYSYEDFFEGLEPLPTGGFAVRDGAFLDWNHQALRDPENTYVLLIEEFSRANVPAVLGELLTYVEYRDRPFDVPISQRQITIADNLVILGTMNPRDRSALEIDDAIIRRLRIVDCPPDVEQLKEMLDLSLEEIASEPSGRDKLINEVGDVFEVCRNRYPDTYELQMPFGHGIFAGVRNAGDLEDLWTQKIRHMLRRPLALPHPFTETIEEAYRWRPSLKATGESSTPTS